MLGVSNYGFVPKSHLGNQGTCEGYFVSPGILNKPTTVWVRVKDRSLVNLSGA